MNKITRRLGNSKEFDVTVTRYVMKGVPGMLPLKETSLDLNVMFQKGINFKEIKC